MILENIRIALRALAANKLRASLTMLGIIIGVGAVIALMSIGRGVQDAITSQFASIGTNLLYVMPGGRQATQTGARQPGLGDLTNGDLAALRDPAAVPDAVGVTGVLQRQAVVVAGRLSKNLSISGVTPDFLTVRDWTVARGQFIDEASLNSWGRVAVLGDTAATDLFPGKDAIGQTIKIRNVLFRVIGVMTAKGGTGFGSQDDAVFIPLTTAQQRLFNSRTQSGDWAVSQIFVQVADQGRIASATTEITDTLRQRHKIAVGASDDFQIISPADMVSALSQVAGTVTLFLGAIAGISLVVGGIGIMNIMLVSVTERTREIGLRKAVGAKRRDILLQFLIEAVVLSLVGGMVGVALGGGIASAVSAISQQIPALLAPDAVALALIFSAGVGLFFGIYPAWRAAGLNPIDALRYE